MREVQKHLTSYKIYLENWRSQIFNDNNAGLTDLSKLFEGVICHIFNTYYGVEDFIAFDKSNFPSVDIKSESKRIVVSVKAKQAHLSSTEISNDKIKLHNKHPDLKEYTFILQQFCDKPKKNIECDEVTIRYFGELSNLFISKPKEMKILIDDFYENQNNIVTMSYLSYLHERYLKYVVTRIAQIYGLPQGREYNYYDFDIDKFNIAAFKTGELFIFRYLEGLWNDLEDKRYLNLRVSKESILLLDTLWLIGHSMNRFKPKTMFEIVSKDNEWKKIMDKYYKDRDPNNFFALLHNYLVRIYLAHYSIKNYLDSL